MCETGGGAAVGTLTGPTRTLLEKPAGLVFFMNFSFSIIKTKTKHLKFAKNVKSRYKEVQVLSQRQPEARV
jgi:hypothetical protein